MTRYRKVWPIAPFPASMASAEDAASARTALDRPEPLARVAGVVARRYYPLALAAAFLATVVGFFPSVIPPVFGPPLFVSPTTSQSPGSAPAPSGPSPVISLFGAIPPLSVTGPGNGPGVAFGAGGYSTGEGTGTQGTVPATPAGSISPPASCPIPIPLTGTPFDGLLYEVISLCQELTGSQGSLPALTSVLGIPGAPTAPSGSSASSARSASPGGWSATDGVFVALDRVLASGGTAPLSPGSKSVLLLGLVQGAGVPAGIDATLRSMQGRGATVIALLAPSPASGGGAAAFASWVGTTLGALPEVDAVAFDVGAPLQGSFATTGSPGSAQWEVADVLAGLASAQSVLSPRQGVGLWWGDGGTSGADALLRQAMTPAEAVPVALRRTTFTGATLMPVAADSTCASLSELRNVLGSAAGTSGLPLLVDAAVGALPSAVPSPAPSCGAGSLSWRVGAGPVRVEPAS